MKKGVDHIGVCVVFYCHDGRGRFLLSKRTKYARDEHGKWDPGGGGVTFGESIISALKREIKEEYGTNVLDHEFLGYRDVKRVDEKGRKTHWIALDYKVLIDPKKVKNGDPKKHEAVDWFTLDNLPSPIHSQMDKFVKKYESKLRSSSKD
jgi:ADP-ribose pyrophosphatase YjhB (NUDIX family)